MSARTLQYEAWRAGRDRVYMPTMADLWQASVTKGEEHPPATVMVVRR